MQVHDALQQYRDTIARLQGLDGVMGNFDALVEYIVEANSPECSLDTLDSLFLDLRDAFDGNDAAIEAALGLLEDHGTADDRSEFFEGWFRDSVLDTEVRGAFRDGRWHVDEVSFTLSYGGPTIRASWVGSDDLEVSVQSWHQTTRGTVTCVALAAEAQAIVDGIVEVAR